MAGCRHELSGPGGVAGFRIGYTLGNPGLHVTIGQELGKPFLDDSFWQQPSTFAVRVRWA